MVKVAFLLNFNKNYKGGINYLKNLFYAVSALHEPRTKLYFFVPDNLEEEYVHAFSPVVTMVFTSVLRRWSFPWFLNKILEKVFRWSPLLDHALKKHGIDVVSHSFYMSRGKQFRILNWVPDLQFLHYPNLWEKKELAGMGKHFKKLIRFSDAVVLSSEAAFQDFCSFAPDACEKGRVLRFVTQPDPSIGSDDYAKRSLEIADKYEVRGKFFYLPNQFWVHKNHITCFKAIKVLKDRGLNPLLVCTGYMNDYRNKNEHIAMLKDYIKGNGLEQNIFLLGLIPYRDVLFLMRDCLAILNPSLFEGWSSTVEEAKSNGKVVVLSDIAVHREQAPARAYFFKSDDVNGLATILENVWLADFGRCAGDENLGERTISFARNFEDIIMGLR